MRLIFSKFLLIFVYTYAYYKMSLNLYGRKPHYELGLYWNKSNL